MAEPNQPLRMIVVVEDLGGRAAVPLLIRRVLWEMLQTTTPVVVPDAICAKGFGRLDTTRDREGVEVFVERALRRRADAVLVVADGDDEGAAPRAWRLRERVALRGFARPVAVVCVDRALESWLILGRLDRTAGCAPCCPGVEGRRDWYHLDPVPRAVAVLECEIVGRKYRKASDPDGLVSNLDLALAKRQSRSFRRLVHALEELLDAHAAGEPCVTPSRPPSGQ